MATTNSFRIIGGRWRSRKLGFTPVSDLRPTTDRIRETLFNWLMPVIEGATCLDLFAGSGALGFEAASRGAAQVDMVEQHNKVFTQLQHNIRLLGADNVTAYREDGLRFLAKAHQQYDKQVVLIIAQEKEKEQDCQGGEYA